MSQSCERVRGALSAFLDGRLKANDFATVRAHIDRCEVCRAEFEALRELSRTVASMPFEALPEGFAASVRDESLYRDRVRVIPRIAAGLLITAGLGGAYWLGLRQGRAVEPAGLQRVAGDDRLGNSDLSTATTSAAEPVAGAESRPADEVPTSAPIELAREPGTLPADTPKAELVALDPEDRSALRAARSLFADLDMVEALPDELAHPLLRAQLEHDDLSEWAKARTVSRPIDEPIPDEVREVARLVERLDHTLERGFSRPALVDLRRAVNRDELWSSDLRLDESVSPRLRTRTIDELLHTLADDLSNESRRSLSAWITFKQGWLDEAKDLDELIQIVQGVGRNLEGIEVGHGMALPDLGELASKIEWTADEDGGRHGVLDVEQETENGSRRIRYEVYSRTILGKPKRD